MIKQPRRWCKHILPYCKTQPRPILRLTEGP